MTLIKARKKTVIKSAFTEKLHNYISAFNLIIIKIGWVFFFLHFFFFNPPSSFPQKTARSAGIQEEMVPFPSLQPLNLRGKDTTQIVWKEKSPASR